MERYFSVLFLKKPQVINIKFLFKRLEKLINDLLSFELFSFSSFHVSDFEILRMNFGVKFFFH